jgi:4-amino-4-deoxy-L-arabinose transferase-like glycosyltransferase
VPERAAPSPFLLAVLAALAANAFVLDLGSYGILDNNEGIYALIAAGMRAGDGLVIPHIAGIPYVEKPPLLYWLTALSFAAFGQTEAAARAVPAAASLATVAIAYWMGRRAGRPMAGWIAGLIVSTSIVTIGIGRTLYFDMLHTALLSAALACAYFGVTERSRRHVRIAAAALALAVLTKGFVGVGLAGIVLAAFLLATRSPLADWLRLLDPVAIAIFAAIAAPWHVAAAIQHDGFAWHYFVNEHIGRLLGTRVPADYYKGNILYYLPRLFAYAAPWSLLLPLAFFRARADAGEPADRFGAFLWAWLAGTLAVFSLAGNKANYYMIVAIVPLCLLIARRIAPWVAGGHARHLWILAGLVVAVTVAGIAAIDVKCGPKLGQLYPHCESLGPSAYASFAGAFALAALLGYAARGREWRAIVPLLAVAAVSVPLRIEVAATIRESGERMSQRDFARRFAAVDDGRPLYVFSKFSDISSFGFYNGRPFGILENIDSDFYLPRLLPEMAARFPTYDELDAIARTRPLYVVTENWRGPGVAPFAKSLPYCTMQRGAKISVLTNVPAECGDPADEITGPPK